MKIVPEDQRLVQVGDEIGSSTVIGVPFFVRLDRRRTHQFVVCECSCGTVFCTAIIRLRRRKQCTCRWISNSAKMSGNANGRKSGSDQSWSLTRLYGIHQKMIDRCLNPKHKHFHHYGARGITICPEWMDFTKFRDWAMANGYADNLTLDRERNSGNYEPSNCRWITQAKQLLNKRTNRHITAFGETKTIKEWSDDSRCIVGENTLRGRINAGYEAEMALTASPNAGGWGCTRHKKPPKQKRQHNTVEAFGETKTILEWTNDSRCLVDHHSIRSRLKLPGWTPEKAISTPPLWKKKC